MILLDRNNAPSNTVYHLAAVVHGVLFQYPETSFTDLYTKLQDTVYKRPVSFEFVVLAVDFLYLLGKVRVNERGDLSVS